MELIKKEKIVFAQDSHLFGLIKTNISFWVSSDLPMEVMDEYERISKLNLDSDDDFMKQKQAHGMMKEALRSILYLHNKKKKVDNFVDKLGVTGLNKIFVFVNNFIEEFNNEKKNN